MRLIDSVRLRLVAAASWLPPAARKPVMRALVVANAILRHSVRAIVSCAWSARRFVARIRNAGFLAPSVTSLAGLILDRAVRNGPEKSRRRLEAGKGRTLWGVTPILTLPLKARADRLLGFESHSLVFVTYYITRNFDFNLRRLVNGVAKYAPRLSPALEKLILAWAISRYDVFHYFYDRGLLAPVTRFGINPVELDLLRAAGKRVYGYAYGADVRRRNATLALGKWNFCSDCPELLKFCICDDTSGLDIMAGMCEKLTAANALGDMLTYVPKARNMHYWPIDLDKITLAPSTPGSGPLRIAHAPNHGHFKGTHYLEEAIDRLKQAGHEIEYIKVQGVPNIEVIRLFGEADVIADQFIGGAYGYTALEAMARGKPVLTYVRTPDLVEAMEECPLLNVTPDTIDITLRWLLYNRRRLSAIGKQGRAYVEKWHTAEAFAARLGTMYEETADFPQATLDIIRAQRQREETRRSTLADPGDWHHPFTMSHKIEMEAALAMAGAPAPDRWAAANLGPAPHDAWHSYDRTPWNQPWITNQNLSVFSSFSEAVFAKLRSTASESTTDAKSIGFVGNIANINYMRANALRRYMPNINVHMVRSDKYVMSLPAWEDFDGEIGDLGDDPAKTLLSEDLAAALSWLDITPDWQAKIQNGEFPFIDPQHVMAWPSYIANADGLSTLQHQNALLVSQFPYLGYLSHRPYVIGPMGGEIWFDAARDDELGRITRLALERAYCVLVSNPITLAHARRYGLKNCLYLPFAIDEEKYYPGPEDEIRAQWQKANGGTFFVCTSMRLDNLWKGAQIALEGFARFAKDAPGARLVTLGWGTDNAAAREQLASLGIQDKVLLLPIVGKARLARYLRAADVLIEQFVLGYYGASGLEAMASGLPVIMRLERAQYEAMVPGGAPPVLDATDPASVAAWLRELHDDPVQRKKIGEATRSWFLATHAGSACWQNYKLILDAAAMGIEIDWTASPLAESLSEIETTYFNAQLENAPAFPEYSL
jgi:glycosyltransferase involved in cell wall biosynthesis